MFNRDDIETYTRQQLYDLVWSKPMSSLAEYFGMSDRGLAKLCERNSIPVPPRGYWAKHSVGKKVSKPPLILLDTENKEQVVIFRDPTIAEAKKSEGKPKAEEYPEYILAAIEKERLPENKIVVLKTLSTPHRIINEWIRNEKSNLEKIRSTYDPMLRAIYERPKLSPEEKEFEDHRRRILSALFKAIDRRGLALESGSNGFKVSLGQDYIHFSIYEYVRQRRVALTDEDYKSDNYWMPGQKWKQVKEDTGLLRLDIVNENGYWQIFRETETLENPFEQRLNDVMIEIIKGLWKVKAKRILRDEEEKRRFEERERRERHEAEIKEENERKERLRQSADLWREAHNIRAYVDAVQGGFDKGQIVAEEHKLYAWKQWALNHADEIDPLKNGSVLSDCAVNTKWDDEGDQDD